MSKMSDKAIEEHNTYEVVTIEILNLFENLLHEKGIDIPSDEREDIGKDAAHLCGMEYWKLNDDITNLLKDSF